MALSAPHRPAAEDPSARGGGGRGSCQAFLPTSWVFWGDFQGHRLNLPPSVRHGPLPPLPTFDTNTCSFSPEPWSYWDRAQSFTGHICTEEKRCCLLAFHSLSSPCSQVIWQWEQDHGWGSDTSWRLPASGRDSGGTGAKCPEVTGVLAVLGVLGVLGV